MTIMSIVDNTVFLIQDGMTSSSANKQDLCCLEDLSWLDSMGDISMDFVDSVLAQSLQSDTHVDDVLFKVAPFKEEGQNQDPIPVPPATTEDITSFWMEFENMEEGIEDMNIYSVESQILPVSRDVFEPIPLSGFPNSAPSIVTNHDNYDQNRYADQTATIPKSENQFIQSNNIVSQSLPASIAVEVSSSQTIKDNSSSASFSDEERSHHGSYCPKFRGYQCDQWNERYQELCEYFDKNGHSSVPHTDLIHKRLARWVKRQRYQYKLRQEGKPSAMTDERVKALERLHFTWDSHGAAFEDRLKELEEFKARHKHCNVPSNYRENSSLASWVKCQRRQYRLYREGKHSNITQARIDQLEQMGFQFNFRVAYHRHHNHQRNSGGWS